MYTGSKLALDLSVRFVYCGERSMDPFPFGDDDIQRPHPPDVTKPFPYDRPDEKEEGPVTRPDVYPARDSLEYHTKEHVQLLTYGPQDTWLVSPTGGSIFDSNPIKRHTPFVIENHECIFQEVRWGGTARIPLTRPRGSSKGEQISTSDLLGPMWLKFELPGLIDRNADEVEVPREIYWTNAIGFAAIESITILTDDRVFDRITGLAMDAWHELDTGDRYEAICQMVGKYETDYAEELLANAPKTIHTPIPWYHGIPEHPYLPLLAVQHTDITLEIRFRHLEECIRAIPGETLGDWTLVRVNLAVYGDAVELQLLTGETSTIEVDLFYETKQVVEQIDPPVPTPFKVGWDTSGQIAIHPETNVLYTTIVEPYTNTLSVASYENNAWQLVGPSPLSEEPIGKYGHSLAFSPNKDLYVAYDRNQTSIILKRFDSTSQTWVNAAPVLYGTVPRDMTFVEDPFRVYLVHNSKVGYPWKTVVSYTSKDAKDNTVWTSVELDNISFYTHGLALSNGTPTVVTQTGVYTWNDENGAYDPPVEIEGNGDYASIVADSESNLYAAVGSLFRLDSGTEEWTKIDGVTGNLIAFNSTVNRILVASENGTKQPIYLYSPGTIKTLPAVDGKINSIAFSLEGIPIVSYVSGSEQFVSGLRNDQWDTFATNKKIPIFDARFQTGPPQVWRNRPRIACATSETHIYVGNAISNAGSVDVYVEEDNGTEITWTKLGDTIAPEDPNETQLFGTSIDVSSDLLVVGSPGWGDDQEGAVYVYAPGETGTGWEWKARLTDENASGLGGSVSTWDDLIVASGTDGIVRMYVQGTNPSYWAPIRTFQVSDLPQIEGLNDPENFGHSVALNGHLLFIGHVGDVNSEKSGVVHVFRYRARTFQWEYETTISPPDSSSSPDFGSGVSFHSFVLTIQSKETIYLYDQGDTDSDWVLRPILTSFGARRFEDLGEGYAFAIGVDYRPERLVVSEAYGMDGSNQIGAIQVFSVGPRETSYRQVTYTFAPDPPIPSAFFGRAVAYVEPFTFIASSTEVSVYYRPTMENDWELTDRITVSAKDISYKRDRLAISDRSTNEVVIYEVGPNGKIGSIKATISLPGSGPRFGMDLSMSNDYLAVVSSNRVYVYEQEIVECDQEDSCPPKETCETWVLFGIVEMPRLIRDVAWRGLDLVWVDMPGDVEIWKNAGGEVWGPFDTVETEWNVTSVDVNDSLMILGTKDAIQVYRYDTKLERYLYRETRVPSGYDKSGGLGRAVSLDESRVVVGAGTMNWVNYPVWFLTHTSDAFAVITSTGKVLAWGASQMGGDVQKYKSLTSDVVSLLETKTAFLAQKTDGSVVAWGGYIQQGLPDLQQVVSLVESTDAFVAVEEDGTMHVWGDPAHGGDPGENPTTGVSLVVSSDYAFAALYEDGTVRAWGDSAYGGDASGVVLENVTHLVRNPHAFVALDACGNAIAWGNAKYGGNSKDVTMTNIKTIVSNQHAFAAIKKDGSVVAWGLPGAGGYTPTLTSESPVTKLIATRYAFLAFHEDGKITTWGDPVFGGNAPILNKPVILGVSNYFSFAVLLEDGTVRAWGPDTMGGSAPIISGVDDIASSAGAFAATLKDRTVIAWGDPHSGGDASQVQSDLKNVNFIQGNRRGFAALRRDGSVVTWGKDSLDVLPESVDFSDMTGPVLSTIGAFAAQTSNGSTIVWGDSRTGGTGDVSSLVESTHALYANDYAFAAIRSNKTVHAWGDPKSGGNASSVLSDLTDVVSISNTTDAFAALRENGKVVAWGNPVTGGSIPESTQTAINQSAVTSVVGNKYSFAAIRANGSVVAWGLESTGGEVPEASGLDSGVVQIVPADAAFAALKANGDVIAWGELTRGGEIQEAITDVVSMCATESAFAALKEDGTVVAWGLPAAGGIIPDDVDVSNVVAVTANRFAFAALKEDGTVVAWGNAFSGGDASEVQAELDSGGFVEIVTTDYAFAARKESGKVVTWGMEFGGGNSDAVRRSLLDIVELKSTKFAFAARRIGGTVVAWGDPFYGGDISTVLDDINRDASMIRGTRSLFLAKTESKWVVWGDISTTTDIPSIGVPVNVGLTYEIDLFDASQLERTLTIPIIHSDRLMRGLLWADGIVLHGPEKSSAMLNDQEFLWKTRTISTVELERGRSSYSILTDDFSLVPNAPVAEIVVYVQSLTRIQEHRWLNTDLPIMSHSTPNRVKLAYMTIEGRDYFDVKSSSTQETFGKQTSVHALQYHSRIPDKLMYVFPISLYPMEYQPSGSINFARIKSAQFHLEFEHTVEEPLSVSFMVLYYKVAVLRDGQFQDAYVT